MTNEIKSLASYILIHIRQSNNQSKTKYFWISKTFTANYRIPAEFYSRQVMIKWNTLVSLQSFDLVDTSIEENIFVSLH